MIHEALRHGRKIDVVLQRNSHNDLTSEDARYTGFDIYWKDGQPAQVNLARMCGIAVRQIFGDQIPCAGSYLVQFYLVPVDNPCAPRLSVPRNLKPRRVYFERQGSMAALHLANGFCTDVVFHQGDDPRMLRWIGFDQLSHGEQQWVDMLAINGGEVAHNFNSARNGNESYMEVNSNSNSSRTDISENRSREQLREKVAQVQA